jgi:GntR family transcriptional regulator, transcriptional repressor for pyruvate dehydrogenase complex
MSMTPPPDLSGAVLRPIRGHHAFEATVAKLGTAIRLGVYPVGSVLPPERDLAARLGVSRATLREAMTALREAGLIQTKRGRHGGALVVYEPKILGKEDSVGIATMNKEWEDALEFRRIVEPGACALLARMELSTAQRGALVEAQKSVVQAQTRSAHRQADSRFHLTIAALTGSERMIAGVTEVQGKLHEMLSLIPVLKVNIEHSCSQHRKIVQRILQGRAKRARKVMEQHCDDTTALIRGLVG